MNKKLNTALFILGATVVNILIMFILVAAGILILTQVLPSEAAPGLVQGLFLLVFVLAIVGSFFIYNKLVKLVTKKIDMEKYFHPIFGPKKKRM
jgi:hypothetical protein